jgi:predicted enzyme related to lactoylglutathione lyase
MINPRFCRFELRTTDIPAAQEFYAAVLGHLGDAIVELPSLAAARGAVPHWLGYIDVSSLAGVGVVADELVARGGTRLGSLANSDSAILRDPGGAVVGLTRAGGVSESAVIWHQLNTKDVERATANYIELFGWSLGPWVDLGALGRFQQFAWRAAEPSVGSIGDVADRPGVHTHWMFHFGVPDLDAALARASARGAIVIGPYRLPSGARVAACDDPQGAAFGLMEF